MPSINFIKLFLAFKPFKNFQLSFTADQGHLIFFSDIIA
jgi:hypothetical protein